MTGMHYFVVDLDFYPSNRYSITGEFLLYLSGVINKVKKDGLQWLSLCLRHRSYVVIYGSG